MKEIIKKRTLKVVGMTCEGCVSRINETLSKIDGVKKVRIKKMGCVYVEYDLMKVSIKGIEPRLFEMGYGISKNIWQKIKTGWIHYSEDTEYENMNLPAPPCCSKPPRT
ncbi:MAG: heavy-metal-associated domain-containing protein [Candidatus Thermoplasmatota archaeon]|nr:heavy-metal-associated domain-containing protein [Candidatus Thermoplasmatota archaeon]MDP7265279.1 heavy-metal-associated domain-containing protein [Candidatus Thermoplasmatota archaeon]